MLASANMRRHCFAIVEEFGPGAATDVHADHAVAADPVFGSAITASGFP